MRVVRFNPILCCSILRNAPHFFVNTSAIPVNRYLTECDFIRGNPPSAGQISVGAPVHIRRLPTAGNIVKHIDRVNGSATRLPRQCDSSVETRLSPDKLLILNHLSVKPYLFPDKLLILCQPISVISRLSVKPHLLPDKLFGQRL